ncbi:YceI family protein [Hyphobacterium sp.]|uniref:YceI family protein n=1 Tax=Hyphobacterium sp. TaxID=2004662 RepID=UPI003748E0A0
MKLLPLALSLFAAGPALATDWTLDRDASAVTIETTAFGREVTGSFSDFNAEIRLDPADLDNARIVGLVDVTSGDTGNAQYNSQMTGNSGLDGDDHPVAEFVSETISLGDDCEDGDGDCYVANGTLTLAGNTQPTDLFFRLSIDGDRAVADGRMTVLRQDFGIGSGEWGDAATTVEIHLHIEATR